MLGADSTTDDVLAGVDLTGRTAVITGSSGGLGLETARALAVDLVGLGAVERLLGDPTVTDVLVNGPGEVWVERAGQLQTTGIVLDRAAVDRAIERLVGPLGLHADRAHPVVDARLADGTRVTAVLPPLAVDGPVLAVRRHRHDPIPLDSLARPDVAALLRERLVGRRNLVVFGATGSGKTTLLASLASELPDHERIITVEDVAELRLPGRGVVRLEARPGGAAGVGRADFRDLVVRSTASGAELQLGDIAHVVDDLRRWGYPFDPAWLEPFLQFRFPLLGTVTMGDVSLELRTAIEPWPVLGEEVTGSGTADKMQIQAMVKLLLPQSDAAGADAADALALAICHAHHRVPGA